MKFDHSINSNDNSRNDGRFGEKKKESFNKALANLKEFGGYITECTLELGK